MRKVLISFLLIPLIAYSHPGVGIVKDSKGNIYYTDLERVWKITNGSKTVLVPNVHTHELYIDKNDNLFGEGGYYDSAAEKFYHYMWVYRSNGRIDTVIGMKQAFVDQDFSLARDKWGNEYYLKWFLPPHTDTNHIYKKSLDGRETVFATGNFKGVKWLHPQEDGSLLYASHNSIYKVDSNGKILTVKDSISKTRPSDEFPWDIKIWGVWRDHANNVYVAAFSDQTVRKIALNGQMTDVYKSTGNWTTLHGVFDNDNNLWVLETSDKNEVRVTRVENDSAVAVKTGSSNTYLISFIVIGCIITVILIFGLMRRNSRLNINRS